MEIKKKLLINVLTQLKPYRNLAEGILALIESSYVDDQAINGIIYLINQSITTVKKENEKTMLKKGLEKIQEIKRMEEANKMPESELDNILADI